jgi:hypothetical protein
MHQIRWSRKVDLSPNGNDPEKVCNDREAMPIHVAQVCNVKPHSKAFI